MDYYSKPNVLKFTRDEFKNYLSKSKKPFMATFYKEVRKKIWNINGR